MILMSVPIKEFVLKVLHVETLPETTLVSVYPVSKVISAQILMNVSGTMIATQTPHARTVMEAMSAPATLDTLATV